MEQPELNNNDNSDAFQLQTGQANKKTILDVLCELAAHVKIAITIVYYLILLIISIGIGYVVLRITIWAANVIIEAAGL